MPQSDTMSQKSTKHKRTASGKLSNLGDQDLSMLRTHLNSEYDDVVLPSSVKFKLNSLFSQIEREFELLYLDNLNLQDKIDMLMEKLDRESIINEKYPECNDMECVTNMNKNFNKQKVLASNPSAQKLKTTNKLKVQTSKIVSSFKTSLLSCYKIRSFSGHRDGVWDVAVRPGQPVLGSASADRTVRLWSTQTGKCVLQYSGHSGSVNSVRFLPNKDLVLSASGDKSVHIWQAVINWECLNNDNDSDLDESKEPDESSITLRTPVKELLGHSNVVIAADWLSDGEQVITASWDRVANLFDVETGTILQSLTGHDEELTFCASHPTQRLAVTCSKDTTFRLWDFRESIHSVCVFQGHTDTVTSAIFPCSGDQDRLVSGADDRTVKVWELRNMRSPLATMRTDSPVNRLSISPVTGIVAIPHDNRQVRLFDLNGTRLGRLPRNNRQGHHRIVTATTWSDDSGLYTCGFDRVVLAWSVLQNKDKKQDGGE
ncbi:hypothetical protein M8J75_015920 [Diaphorina citri]|nr:hypothetical protein M8J75_015920 [Diaphorina citri]